jgi:hypothetical protein
MLEKKLNTNERISVYETEFYNFLFSRIHHLRFDQLLHIDPGMAGHGSDPAIPKNISSAFSDHQFVVPGRPVSGTVLDFVPQ